jgi:hypothetical protein
MKGSGGRLQGRRLAWRVEAEQTLGLQAGKPYYEGVEAGQTLGLQAGKAGRGGADSRVTGWESLL